MDADGDFVVAWTSNGQDGSGYGVYAQRYNARGVAQGDRVPRQLPTPPALSDSRGGDGRRRRLRRRLASSSARTAAATASTPSATTPPASPRAASSASTPTPRATSRYPRWRWTPTATSSSPGRATARTAAATASTPSGTTRRASPRAASSGSTPTPRATSGTPRWRWTPTATSSSPGTSYGQDGSGYGVYAQRYNAGGRRPGGEFRVNTYTTSDQRLPAVAMDADGDFVVAWRARPGRQRATASTPSATTPPACSPSPAASSASTPTPTASRAFPPWRWTPTATSSSPGRATARTAAATASTPALRRRRDPRPRRRRLTAALTDGCCARDRSASAARRWCRRRSTWPAARAATAGDRGFRRALSTASPSAPSSSRHPPARQSTRHPWRRMTTATSSSPGQLRQRRRRNWSASSPALRRRGRRAGRRSSASTPTPRTASATSSVAMDADGDFVVAWAQQRPGRQRLRHLRPAVHRGGRRRSPDASSASTPTPRAQPGSPAVAMDADGDFVVAWPSYGQDGSGYGVYAQRYNAAGVAQASEFRVNTYTDERPAIPRGGDGRRRRLRRRLDERRPGRQRLRHLRPAVQRRGRRARAASSASTPTPRAPARSRRWRWTPTATSSSPGRAAGQDGSGYGIYAQRYNARGRRPGQRVPRQHLHHRRPVHPAVAMDADGDFVVAWTATARTAAATASTPSGTTRRASPRAASSGSTPTPRQPAQYPAVAMDADGDFVVAWQRTPGRTATASTPSASPRAILDIDGNGSTDAPHRRSTRCCATCSASRVRRW